MSSHAAPSPALPLAARNALVGLLLSDLAEGRAPRSRVAEALELLDGDGSSSEALRGDAEVPAALVEAGVLAYEPAAACGVVRVAAPWRGDVVATLRAYARAIDGLGYGADPTSRLAQARRLFAHHLYFEVHEVLEPAWQRAAGGERRTLQGLIQAAAAWHHWQRGNASGAWRLARAAQAKLLRAPASWRGFPVAEVRRCIEGWDAWLSSGAAGRPPALPFVDEAASPLQ
jgi:hypothetical protein